MIYIELNEHSFACELSKNKDNWFSYEGAKALYNYLNDCWIDIEFDAVALRSEFSEYTKEDIEEVMQYIEDNTILIEIDDGNYIIQDF